MRDSRSLVDKGAGLVITFRAQIPQRRIVSVKKDDQPQNAPVLC